MRGSIFILSSVAILCYVQQITTALSILKPNRAYVDDFVCTQQGIFPDPKDCNKYHVCAGKDGTLEDHPEECAKGFSYDPLTTVCSLIRDINCRQPVPVRCTGSNSTGRVERNPRLYYQCGSGSTTPKLYYCLPDQKYIKDRCHDVTLPYGIEDGRYAVKGWLYVPNCSNVNRCADVDSLTLLSNCNRPEI